MKITITCECGNQETVKLPVEELAFEKFEFNWELYENWNEFKCKKCGESEQL